MTDRRKIKSKLSKRPNGDPVYYYKEKTGAIYALDEKRSSLDRRKQQRRKTGTTVIGAATFGRRKQKERRS